MNRLLDRIFVLLAVSLIFACATAARPVSPAGDAAPLVLGSFDSRAVAVAHARSPAFAAELADLRAEHETARRGGDDARAAELDAHGRALQEQLHAQGFSTASVSALLAPHAAELDALARAAGVDAVVSRWDLVWTADDARTVDLTDAVTALFDPDATTLRMIRELREQPPAPLGELDHRR